MDRREQAGGAACGASEAQEAKAPYRIAEPARLSSGAVFSSPHSGRAYFREFLDASPLALAQLRASEDAFMDRLFGEAARCGAPLLSAVAPRAYVDLNRCPRELDPALLEGVGRRAVTARVAAGLGVVPRIVAEGVDIYDRKLSMAEAEARLRRWHAPYHEQLARMLLRAQRRFGRALLIDCHSMPSCAAAPGRHRATRVDVVLGDRFGVSADPDFVDAIEAAFIDAGFRVGRNAPFAGGFITERYGRPAAGVSAVQIEIDRGLYLDELRVAPTERFSALAGALKPVIRRIASLIGPESSRLSAPSLAAE